MKIVQRSKSPTVQQMLNMAANLYEKFNKPSDVIVDAWRFTGSTPGQNRAVYRLYTESTISEDFDSWQECQDRYFSLMRRDND